VENGDKREEAQLLSTLYTGMTLYRTVRLRNHDWREGAHPGVATRAQRTHSRRLSSPAAVRRVLHSSLGKMGGCCVPSVKVRRVDFYPDDWIAGTVELDDIECGIYIRACALIYAHGGPITIDLLKRACSSHGNRFNFVLKRLVEGGKLLRNGIEIDSKRCRNEIERSSKRLRKASENGAKGGRPKDLEKAGGFANGKANNAGTNQQPSTIIEDSPPLTSFADPPLEGGSPNHKPAALALKAEAKPKRALKLLEVPEDWEPDQAGYEYAAENAGWDRGRADAEVDHFRCLHGSKGNRFASIPRAWKTWVRNGAKFDQQRQGSANGNGHAKQSAAEKLFDGADRAWRAFEARRRVGQSADEPLLDLGRSSGDPPSSNRRLD
jgi:uncharacterized protein YdaU (DUF1376 family)